MRQDCKDYDGGVGIGGGIPGGSIVGVDIDGAFFSDAVVAVVALVATFFFCRC